MNNTRRKQIKSIIEKLSEIKNEIETVTEDEEEYLDNIPESLQESERYEKSEVALENLNNASDTIDELIKYLEEAME